MFTYQETFQAWNITNKLIVVKPVSWNLKRLGPEMKMRYLQTTKKVICYMDTFKRKHGGSVVDHKSCTENWPTDSRDLSQENHKKVRSTNQTIQTIYGR